MRNLLMATTAVAFAGGLAAAPASAADMLSIGIGGYMEQWVGMASVDGAYVTEAAKAGANKDGSYNGTPEKKTEKEGAIEVHADTELYFKGTLAADNGLTFTVDVQLEGTNNQGGYIDESSMKVTGEFGDVRIGAEDAANNLMHYGHEDVGVGFTAGDTKAWLGFGTPHTAGGGTSLYGDVARITYFTPRMEGVQLGFSYTPDTGVGQAEQTGERPTANNDSDASSVGLNYTGAFGDTSIALSAGYHAESAAVSGDDDATYTNFGLRVGMGAFGFNVAYGEADDGKDADTDKDHETVTVGAKYTQGPMAVSVGYGAMDRGNGSEMTTSMLSASYTLAPGVAWKSSFFQAEDGDMEGSGFATGIKINF